MAAGAVPLVLLVCPCTIGRSQTAAALLSHCADGAVEVRSAGPEPEAQVDPLVVAVLQEAGVPIEGAYP